MVRLHNSPLPDNPEEFGNSDALGNLQDAGHVGALFVDGCKSWTSTRYAMQYLLPRMRPGAPVIFQDYGWYTCFWITSFTYALREFLELETYVDATYVYKIKRGVTAAEINKRFAGTPMEMGETFFAEAAAYLMSQSQASGDLRGELISQLHHVAALVTIGRRRSAAEFLKRVDVQRYAAFAEMIRGCIKSPTYLPGGKQLLWDGA